MLDEIRRKIQESAFLLLNDVYIRTLLIMVVATINSCIANTCQSVKLYAVTPFPLAIYLLHLQHLTSGLYVNASCFVLSDRLC